MTLFKIIRIIFLLGIFVSVAFFSKYQKLKSRAWSEPLTAVIYPINADGSESIRDYIDQLDDAAFRDVDDFFEHEGEGYELITAQPFVIRLAHELKELPPEQPNPGASMLAVAWWSLKLRYWAYRHADDAGDGVRIVRVFVNYHEANKDVALAHSLGLDKGLLTLVHAFASKDQEAQNNIIIAHELLHTVGATDKYDVNSIPVYPDGFADPEQVPLYPQHEAEIMAGRVPVSADMAVMPKSLRECIVGEKTAREINWLPMESD